MKLFKISQDVNNEYDTYSEAIVCAENEDIEMLKKAGYKPNKIMIFMICNWKIPYEECLRKLDLCKVWNVQVADCYFDNQIKDIEPVHWTKEQIKDFRAKCRKHNQLVNFKIDPEIKTFK